MRGVKKKSVVYKKRLLLLQQHYQGLAIAISNLRFFFFFNINDFSKFTRNDRRTQFVLHDRRIQRALSMTAIYKYVNQGRSGLPEVFCKNGALRNFAKFAGKHLCQSHFLIKLQTSGCHFIKKETLALLWML